MVGKQKLKHLNFVNHICLVHNSQARINETEGPDLAYNLSSREYELRPVLTIGQCRI